MFTRGQLQGVLMIGISKTDLLIGQYNFPGHVTISNFTRVSRHTVIYSHLYNAWYCIVQLYRTRCIIFHHVTLSPALPIGACLKCTAVFSNDQMDKEGLQSVQRLGTNPEHPPTFWAHVLRNCIESQCWGPEDRSGYTLLLHLPGRGLGTSTAFSKAAWGGFSLWISQSYCKWRLPAALTGTSVGNNEVSTCRTNCWQVNYKALFNSTFHSVFSSQISTLN